MGKILPRILAKQPGASRTMEVRLQIVFRSVLGEQLAAACEEITVRGTTVWVTTGNPALAHQLRLDAEVLVARLNDQARLPRQIRQLRVRIGRAQSFRGR
ncbi:MAG: DUF721 domain-containing protein [Candidatus Dormibacteraeota bacterium]|nr:DUF721 domain-containing protein [Candidatus Dormibacteraeota bacterium]